MPHTRVTMLWSGAAGLPGYTRMRFQGALTSAEALAVANRMKTWATAISGLIPSVISLSFSEAAQVYSDSGVLTGEVTYAPPAAVVGGSAGVYAAPTGAVSNWTTGAVFQGRKTRGRTFLVPLGSAAFQADGTLISATITTIQGAGQALLGGTPKMVIFSQKPGGPYQTAEVTGCTVPDRAAILKSRRD